MTLNEIKRIRQWVHLNKELIVNDIADLVKIPSVSSPSDCPQAPFGGSCLSALNLMKKKAEDFGFTVYAENEMCCQIAMDEIETGKPQLGLWGHLDVVPEGGGWYFPPFELTEKNGYIIGRGVQDNKGPAVALLYVFRCLKELGYKLPYNCLVCYGTSEENGMLDLRQWGKQNKFPDYNLVADCGFPVCYGEMGTLRVAFYYDMAQEQNQFEIFAGNAVNMMPDYASYKEENTNYVAQARGIACHVAVPHVGENALANLASYVMKTKTSMSESQQKLWAFIYKMTSDGYGKGAGIECEDNISGKLCGTMTWARKNKNQIELQADYRYPLFNNSIPFDGMLIINELTKLAQEHGLSIKVLRNDLPSYYPKEKPLVQSVLKTYRELTKSKTEPFVMSGGTYARMLPNAIAFGMASEEKRVYSEAGWPSVTGDYHQANESLRLEELLEGIVIYCAALVSLNLE